MSNLGKSKIPTEHAPRPLPGFQVVDLNLTVSTKYPTGSALGAIENGRVFAAGGGNRLVIYVSWTDVVFITANKFYAQSLKGFVNDVTSYPLVKGAQGAVAMARFSQIAVEFIIGCVAGYSFTIGVAVLYFDVVKYCMENHRKIENWAKYLKAVQAARKELKQMAPVLYEKVICSLFWKTLKRHSITNLADAKPEALSRMAGQMVGEIGTKGFQARLSAFWIIVAIVKNLAVKSATSVVDALEKTGKGDIAKIEAILRDVGEKLTLADIEKIREEISKNGKKIKEVFDRHFEPLANLPV